MSETIAKPAPPAIDSAKRQQILDGARRVFLGRGFDAASMGEIARAAAVSKGTLYVYFDSKEALFRELIAQKGRVAAERLTELDAEEDDVAKVLAAFARCFITQLTKPDHVSLVRIVIGAAEAFPDLGRAFFAAGPGFGAERLRVYLAARVEEGRLEIEDAELAAWHFIGMCKEPALLSSIMCGAPPPEPEAVERYADAAVRAFLRAYGPAAAGRD